MTDKTVEAHEAFATMPSFDISNEAWREYVYPNGNTLHVTGAVKLYIDKRPDGDRHRLVLREYGKEVGLYVTPGWLGIRWQTPDGKHGITF